MNDSFKIRTWLCKQKLNRRNSINFIHKDGNQILLHLNPRGNKLVINYFNGSIWPANEEVCIDNDEK